MRGERGNIFVSYRGPESRDELEDPGRQLEDNATKSLLHLIDYGDPQLVESILGVLVEGTSARDAVADTVTSGGTVDTRTQERIDSVELAGRTPILVGVSDAGRDPLSTDTDYDERGDDRRLDGVVFVGDAFVIVTENKFQGAPLLESQMSQYKQHLSIEDEYYTVTSWVTLHDAIEELLESTTGLNPVSKFLARQFAEFLELQGLEVSTASSSYERGENIVTLEKYPTMNVATSLASQRTPDYAVHFDTTSGSGYEDVYLTEAELTRLLEQLEETCPEIREGLTDGDFGPIEDFARRNEVEGSVPIAEIGDERTGRKRLQVAVPEDSVVLGIRRARPGKQYSPNGYWMVAEREFESLFSGEGSGGLPTEKVSTLFGDSPNILSLGD